MRWSVGAVTGTAPERERGRVVVFKKMMGALGVGGPKVDTVLAVPRCRPGEELAGEVRVTAADYAVEVQRVTLGLVTRMEIEHEEGESGGVVEFHRADVAGAFRLAAKEDRVIPFRLPVPWETPVTEVYGQPLHGMAMGVRTELAVAKAVDKGDLDPVAVVPLPSQERVLEGFERAGFTFKSADVEHGHIHGVVQELPFYQEIEFYPPPAYAGRINEVELTFVADPGGLAVVLEADKRSGLFGSSDQILSVRLGHEEAAATDWGAELAGWLDALAGGHSGVPAGGSHGHYGEHGHYDGHHGHHDGHGHRRGPGWGGVAAGAAAGVAVGVAGGMVAGEIMEEIFEDDEED
ncbi:sporulation protein [Actinomadura viridis]|uniref:Sporulation-control protein n=1 Tax=Actinomadura viridis TaxID=58110 RepID=A0A931GJ04_9ACTN|nr:sporulation protein [Actinomadura viridis]MBG6089163.1 sporulation-control protein [Actinomadura viridis]